LLPNLAEVELGPREVTPFGEHVRMWMRRFGADRACAAMSLFDLSRLTSWAMLSSACVSWTNVEGLRRG
jgi:hypothetical protein